MRQEYGAFAKLYREETVYVESVEQNDAAVVASKLTNVGVCELVLVYRTVAKTLCEIVLKARFQDGEIARRRRIAGWRRQEFFDGGFHLIAIRENRSAVVVVSSRFFHCSAP